MQTTAVARQEMPQTTRHIMTSKAKGHRIIAGRLVVLFTRSFLGFFDFLRKTLLTTRAKRLGLGCGLLRRSATKFGRRFPEVLICLLRFVVGA